MKEKSIKVIEKGFGFENEKLDLAELSDITGSICAWHVSSKGLTFKCGILIGGTKWCISQSTNLVDDGGFSEDSDDSEVFL